jgi:C-terminal processing protease CtpA/Prc
MIDGGRIAVPNYGMLTERDGWIIEGVGVPPDVGVANDPHAFSPGRDLHLQKGVQLMLESLKKSPPRRPTFPRDPVRIAGVVRKTSARRGEGRRGRISPASQSSLSGQSLTWT